MGLEGRVAAPVTCADIAVLSGTTTIPPSVVTGPTPGHYSARHQPPRVRAARSCAGYREHLLARQLPQMAPFSGGDKVALEDEVVEPGLRSAARTIRPKTAISGLGFRRSSLRLVCGL